MTARPPPRPNICLGKTSLHLAAEQGCEEICTMLLDAGADKSVKERDGDTAYDMAEDSCLEMLWDGVQEKKETIEQQDDALMKNLTSDQLHNGAHSAELAEQGLDGAMTDDTKKGRA